MATRIATRTEKAESTRRAIIPLDPDFGLHLAEMAVAAQPALPWHLVRASATLAEGSLRLLAAWRVFNDLHPPELILPGDGRANEGHAVLRMRTKNTPYPMPRHAAEYAFAWFIVASRRATGVDVTPVRLSFEHARPATEHERIFRCEIEFRPGRDDDRLCARCTSAADEGGRSSSRFVAPRSFSEARRGSEALLKEEKSRADSFKPWA